MKYDARRIKDESEKEGVKGIYYYVDKHLNSPCRDTAFLTLDDLYVHELAGRITDKAIPDDKDLLLSVIGDLPSGSNILEWSLGLENGCAGYVLKQVLS